MKTSNRRHFLKFVVGAGTAGLAGCTASNGESTPDFADWIPASIYAGYDEIFDIKYRDVVTINREWSEATIERFVDRDLESNNDEVVEIENYNFALDIRHGSSFTTVWDGSFDKDAIIEETRQDHPLAEPRTKGSYEVFGDADDGAAISHEAAVFGDDVMEFVDVSQDEGETLVSNEEDWDSILKEINMTEFVNVGNLTIDGGLLYAWNIEHDADDIKSTGINLFESEEVANKNEEIIRENLEGDEEIMLDNIEVDDRYVRHEITYI